MLIQKRAMRDRYKVLALDHRGEVLRAGPLAESVDQDLTFGGWAAVPVTTGNQQWVFRLQQQVHLTNVLQGQVIRVNSLLGTRNDTGINLQIDDFLGIYNAWPPTPTWDWLDMTGSSLPYAVPSLVAGVRQPYGYDVNQQMHYSRLPSFLAWQADQNYPALAIASWLESTSSDAQPGMYVQCVYWEMFVEVTGP